MSAPTNLPVIQGVPLKGVYLKKRALKITRKNGDIEYVEVPAEAMEMGLRYAEREDYSCELSWGHMFDHAEMDRPMEGEE